MSGAKGPASKEDVPVKVRLSFGVDKTNNPINSVTAAPSTYGSDVRIAKKMCLLISYTHYQRF